MENIPEQKLESKEKGFEKISPTAKFVAYQRTFTDIPYSKEMAEVTDAKEIFEKIAGDGKNVEHTIAMFEARFKSVSNALAERKVKNVVEIATGLSPRPLIMTEDPQVNYVATDLPDILNEVKEIEKVILGNQSRSNLKFQELNVLDKNELLRIIGIFSDQEPVAITMEGLLMYLDREEQMKVAKNIHEALKDKDGFWITTDFMIRDRLSDNETARKNLIGNINNATGRTMRDNMFEDEKEIERFLDATGFRFEKISQVNLIDELSCLNNPNVDLDKEKASKYLENKYTYILYPIK